MKGSGYKPGRKRLDDDDSGVASTVGTIMALMVFLSFLALFTNQWVPVYMQESEASHVNEIMLTMTRFKTDMDMQILAYRIAQLINYSAYVPPNMYHAFKLGADGIPVFASDTAGILNFRSSAVGSDRPLFRIGSFNYTGGNTFEGYEAGGTMDIYMPNRYFVQERIIYEDGAIIVKQPEGAYVKDGPQFFVEKGSGVLNISMTLVHLFGTDRTITGTAPAGISSDLLWVESDTYTRLSEDLVITFYSEYSAAWDVYFTNYLATVSGLNSTTDYSVTHVQSGDMGTVTLTFSNVNVFDLQLARFKVSVGDTAI